MKYLIWLFLLLPFIGNTQLTPKNYTIVPTYLIAGQSNGDNFWNYASYNTPGQGNRQSYKLADTLESIWSVPKVNVFYHSPAGIFLYEQPSLVDWNINSVNEHYDYVMKMWCSDSIRTASNKFPSFAKEADTLYDIKFVIWIQGENDASGITEANAYYTNLTNLIAGFRNDLSRPNLPFIIVKLNDDINRGSLGPVRAAQQQIGDEDPNSYTIDIDDFDANSSTYYSSAGNVHYSYNGLNIIMNRIISVIRTNNID